MFFTLQIVYTTDRGDKGGEREGEDRVSLGITLGEERVSLGITLFVVVFCLLLTCLLSEVSSLTHSLTHSWAKMFYVLKSTKGPGAYTSSTQHWLIVFNRFSGSTQYVCTELFLFDSSSLFWLSLISVWGGSLQSTRDLQGFCFSFNFVILKIWRIFSRTRKFNLWFFFLQ